MSKQGSNTLSKNVSLFREKLGRSNDLKDQAGEKLLKMRFFFERKMLKLNRKH
jgi:hypothetical protein